MEVTFVSNHQCSSLISCLNGFWSLSMTGEIEEFDKVLLEKQDIIRGTRQGL